jgi:ABC-type uncharacterized transport system permease subunit
LFILTSKTKAIVGYSLWQIVFFYATFNFLDALPQFVFRNVYRFRQQILNGYFDYLLLKPVPSLFHPLFGGSDMLDLIILAISVFFIIYSALHIPQVTLLNTIGYIALLTNALLIALSFHIFVLAVGILTTTVDNAIMLYRDITQMGRLPVDIYKEPLRGLLTFVIPVGIMMTFPGKALLGLLSLQTALIAFAVGIVFFGISLRLWRHSLKSYTSASS